MYGRRIKSCLLVLTITVFTGCASSTKAPTAEKHYMDLDQAFRERGVYLNENGELTDLSGQCVELPSGTPEWQACFSNRIFKPVLLDYEEVLTNPTATKLIRALPKDADLNNLQTQLKLIAEGQYRTWSGELLPFPPEKKARQSLSPDAHQAFKSDIPASSSEGISLSTDPNKIRFK